MKARHSGPSNAQRATILARLALAGVVLYVVLDIVAQVLPPHYNPISQAESDLAVGPYGYVMAINFGVRGVLSLAAVQALRDGLPVQARSRAGELLLSIWAIGALILALATTDLPGHHPSLHGLIHLVVALLAFIAGAIGALLVSLRLRADPRMQAIAPVATTVAIGGIVMLLALFSGIDGANVGGLIERLFLGLILLWIVIVAARLQSARV